MSMFLVHIGVSNPSTKRLTELAGALDAALGRVGHNRHPAWHSPQHEMMGILVRSNSSAKQLAGRLHNQALQRDDQLLVLEIVETGYAEFNMGAAVAWIQRTPLTT